jgi:CRP-like cAMP-binding protein
MAQRLEPDLAKSYSPNPLIARLGAFTRLSADDRHEIELASQRSVRTVAARRDLIREGEAPRFVYLVLEGWACRYKSLPDGRRQIVSFFLPGDICDLHIYVLRRMDHSVGAITPLKVAEVRREDFQALVKARPRLLQAMWWGELVGTAIQREWTLSLGQRSAFERVGHLFCELFLRLQCVGLTRGDSCEFPMTQLDIAEATGLTSVHVNRTLQEMRREGLIELHGRRLTIPDLERLKATSLFTANYLHLEHEGRALDAVD